MRERGGRRERERGEGGRREERGRRDLKTMITKAGQTVQTKVDKEGTCYVVQHTPWRLARAGFTSCMVMTRPMSWHSHSGFKK